MEQEARFFAVLQQVRQVTLENNQQLTLTYGEEPTAGSLVFSPR
jgi:heat shock protein HslJ